MNIKRFNKFFLIALFALASSCSKKSPDTVITFTPTPTVPTPVIPVIPPNNNPPTPSPPG